MSFADWSNEKKKKKQEQEQEQEQSGTIDNSASPKTSFADWSANKIVERVDQDYINSFLTDADNFFNTAEEEFKKISYGTASSSYATRRSTWDDLDARATTIGKWLERNKSNLDEETYNGLSKTLTDIQKGATSIVTGFRQQNDYFSQWKTEDEYNSYLEYEGMKTADLDAVQKEIENLEKKLKDVEGTGDGWFSSLFTDYSTLDEQKELKNQIAEKKTYYNRAKRLQDAIALSKATGNEDFEANSGYVSTEYDDKDVWSKLGSDLGLGYGDLAYEYINNQNGMRDTIKHKSDVFDSSFSDGESVYEEKNYDQMNETEVAIYNYYYATEGKEKAEQFLDSIQETLNMRAAYSRFEQLEDNTFIEILFGAEAGLDQFENGVKSLFNFEDDYIPQSSTQMVGGMVREDLADDGFKIFGTSIGQIGYDILNTTANMLPSILLSTGANMIVPGAGNIVGSVMLGASAAGNAKAEMLQLGYDKGQANAYGLLVGASEAGLQYLLGGISSLGGGNGGVFGSISNKVLTKVDNAFARAAIKIGGSMLDEGLEEGLQTIIEPWLKSLVTGADFDAPNIDEVLYSSLLGALSAGVLEGVGTVAGEVQTYNQGKALKEAGTVEIDRLVSLGQTFSADSEAYKLAGKVNEKTGAYTIGRLLNEIGASLSEQNLSDITTALKDKGITETDAKTIAKWLNKAVNGGYFTKKQQQALEENEVISNVFKEVIIDQNSTVNQRILGYNEAIELAKNGKKTVTNTTEPVQKPSSETLSNDEIARRIAEATGQDVSEVLKNVTNQNAPSEQSNKKSIYETSETGKTTQVSTGEEVNIKEIASIKGKDITLRLDNGETVKASDIEFGSNEEGLLYENVVDMGLNAETANAFVRGYDPSEGLTVQEYALGFREAYRYGEYNIPVQEMSNKGFSARLNETKKSLAYKLGQTDAKYRVSEKQNSVPQTKVYNNVDEGTMSVEEAMTTNGLTDRQKVSLKSIKALADALGLKVRFFESKIVNGEIVGENGRYDTTTGTLYFDLYAGAKGNGVILFTAAHELTHFIRQWSPAKFKTLADIVLEEYGKKGVSVEELIQKQIEKAENRGRTISYDTAYEEVIADSFESILADGEVFSKIAERVKAKDKTLWQKIKDFFKGLVAKIRGVYKGLKPDSREGRLMAETLKTAENLQTLWAEALVDASESFSKAETVLAENGIAIDSETESASLLSVRDVLGDKQREKVSKALATRFGVTQQEAMSWLDAETSLSSLILNPKYSQYLDYTADENEEAIKSNSDYPQGTVDFSNICKKRRDFTEIMNRVLRNFPNHIFEPTDLAKIRTIMMEEGMEVACGICYVEDRRQLDSVIGQFFVDSLAIYREGGKIRPDGKPFNKRQLQALEMIEADTYTPSIYELVTLEGRNKLKAKNPNMADAWVMFNNARGMQSIRLLLNDAEYKRQILKYNKNTVKGKNDKGGLRIYSFSDMEMFHLIDIIQVITDSATVGLSLQGYTKVNEYARAVKDTGEKLNRSLIPKGDLGYHMEKGKVVLDFDTVEGIDINHPDFFDSTDNPNVGNIVIGINATQIRAAMTSKFIDQIIPFHTGQSNEVLGEKGIASWVNYKDFQTEKDIATGNTSEHQINIYTEVIQAAEKEGKPITNKVEFVNKFLEVCKENNLVPRFSEFLNTDENGNYVYTEGYHKFLVDFKTFDQKTGKYLPQMPVKPIFDSNYLTQLLKDYVKTQQVKDAKFTEAAPKVIERIENEVIKPNSKKFSDRESWKDIKSIQGLESYSVDEVIDITTSHIQSVLEEYGEYAEIIAVRPLGSRAKGTAKADSDLDIVVQYEGDIREDDMFNMLNDEDSKLYIEGIEVDINPIRADESGDIEDYLGRVYDYDKYSETKYSTRDSLGNELSTEQQEFFKDSKVRDEDGNLLVVYHGTETGGFTLFSNSHSGDAFWFADKTTAESYIDKSAIGEEHWSGKGKTSLYEVYINAKNPLIIDADGYRAVSIPTDIFPQDRGRARFHHIDDIAFYAMDNGYDGLIVKNVKDYGIYTEENLGISDDNDLPVGNVYAVFDSNQIKSTSNKKPTSDPDILYSERDTLGNELSMEQQEFFKDSKVRDEDGRLTPVYHGTPNGGFTEFKLPHYLHTLTSANGAGYYFTDERNARQYMKGLNGKSVTQKKLYKVYLNITNPLQISEYSTGAISDDAFRRIMARGNYEWGMAHTDVEKILKYSRLDTDRLAEMVKVFNGEEILSVMKEELGYDGVRYTDKYGDVWVAWDKTQIKNTTNKTPTSDPDIRYSERDALPDFDDIDAWFESLSSEELMELMGDTDIVETIDSLPTKQERRDAYVSKLYSNGNLNKVVTKLVKTNPQMAEYFANTQMNNKYNPLFPSKSDEYIVMFHGSPNQFNTFDTSKIGANGTAMGSGIYFTANRSYAESYEEEGGRIIATLLNIEKPLSRNKLTITKSQIKSFIRQVVDSTGDDFLSNYGDVNTIGYEAVLNKATDMLFEHNRNDADLIESVYVTSRMEFDEFHNGLTNLLGYDGIIAWNKAEGTQAVVFKSNQAKDIFNFNPTSNPDIRYSFRDTESGMANDSLSPYDEELTYFIEQRGDYIVDSFEKLTQIVNLAFDNPSLKATAYFGIINSETLEKIKNSIPNLAKAIEGILFKEGKTYSIATTFDSIRHIVDEKSLSREDVINYLDRLADTILEFDSVAFDFYYSNGGKMPGLLFKKEFEDGTLVSFTLVSHKKRSIVLHSLYLNNADYQKKKVAETLLMQNAPAHTPKAKVGQPSDNSIPQSPNSVNSKLSDRDTATFKGKPFWSGSVSLLDGVIEEVHSFDEAEDADFHHTMYFSKAQLEKMENGDNAFFFVENGKVQGNWRESIPKSIINKIKEQIVIDTKLSDRDTEGFSNRTLLANALEGTVANDIEKRKLQEYKAKIDLIDKAQAKLMEIRAEAQRLRFTKGRTAEETAQMKELDAEATRIANRINTYDRQLLSLESTTALKNVLEREKKMAYDRAEQIGRERLNAYRERAAQAQRTLMERVRERQENARERKNKTEMRHKIKKVVSDLNTLLLKPTKDKHIPIGLQYVVAKALFAINMDVMNAGERAEFYNQLIANESDPDKIAEFTKTRDFFEYRDMNFREKATALKNAYSEFLKSDDPLIKGMYSEDIDNLIEATIRDIGNKSLKDMSIDELESVHKMYTGVLATVRNVNKTFKDNIAATIQENSETVKTEVKEVGGETHSSSDIAKWFKKQGWDMLKPVYAMKVIGSKTLMKLYENVRAGEDTWAVDVSEAQSFLEELKTKYNHKKWDFKKQYEFTDGSGDKFSLSLELMMSIYAYSRRPQAEEHMEVGGFVFDDSIKVDNAKPHKLDKNIIKEIVDTLTDEQKLFADEMQTYLSDVMGAKGNEVSLAMYDIKLFGEKYYFPIKSSKDYLEFNPEQAATPKIKNSGFTKSTIPHATNPIILSNFTDIWASHVDKMAMYHAFTLPLEDFMRVYNYQTREGGYESVKGCIHNAWGLQANQYIEKLMVDLNGGARVDSTAGLANTLIGLHKKASVMGSASVVIQQFSAIPRAFAYINPKYFAKSIFSALNLGKHKTVWEEVKKYAPIAIIKEMGYFDTGMGQATVDWIKGDKTFMDKVDDALSKMPALADEWSWSYIWLAVKNEIKSTTNLKVDSEEFLKKCGERFTEVITNTQVYDSVLSRSAMMRSKDTGMKMATSFMAEPTTTFNMVVDAFVQGKRGNKKYTGAVIGGVVASVILNSILVSLVYGARDDDEDETYAEKYLASLTSELIEGLNPLTYIPFVKDIWSIAQGYDVERADMSVISNLWETIEGLFNEDTSGWDKALNTIGAVSSIFGLPVKNLIRDAKAIYNVFEHISNGVPTTGAGIGESIGEAAKDSIPLWGRLSESKTNSDRLYDAIVSGDQNQIDRIKGRFKDDKAIKSAMRQGLRDNDSRIKEAAQARIDGDIAEYTRIAKEIITEKNFSQDIVVGAINAEINALKKGENTEPSTDTNKVSSIYSMDDYFNALDEGSTADAVKEAIIQVDVANGKDRDDAESDFLSRFTSNIRDRYEEGSISYYEAINMLVNYGGKTQESADSKLQYWDFQKRYPNYELSEEAVNKYYSNVEPYGISVGVYYDYSKARSKCKGTDNNGDGKTDSGSVKAEVMQVIDSLPLADYQKDALYYLNGWSASTIYEAPWN